MATKSIPSPKFTGKTKLKKPASPQSDDEKINANREDILLPQRFLHKKAIVPIDVFPGNTRIFNAEKKGKR